MQHHWLEANMAAKCVKCKNTVSIFQGRWCRWCKNLVNQIYLKILNFFKIHTRCTEQYPKECGNFIKNFYIYILDFGQLAYHILPPVNIIPTFLERSSQQTTGNHQQINNHKNSQSSGNLFQVIFIKFFC